MSERTEQHHGAAGAEEARYRCADTEMMGAAEDLRAEQREECRDEHIGQAEGDARRAGRETARERDGISFADVRDAVYSFREVIPTRQAKFMLHLARSGEESEYWREQILTLCDKIAKLPKVGGQDGQGDQAVAHLHLFGGPVDIYVTELTQYEGEVEAFGQADLGCGPELGYLDMAGYVNSSLEIDLHFDPTPLAQINAKASGPGL